MSERQRQVTRVEGLRTLAPGEIEPGDVILFRGKNPVSKLIRFVDDSVISHVALATGPDTIIQSSRGGVRVVPLASEMADAELAVVRRSRGEEAAKRRHIVQAAEALQHGPYSYESVLLLAVQCTFLKRIPAPLRKLLRRFLNSATGTLRRMVGIGRSPLFCSELIWVAFHRASCKLYIPESGLTTDMLIAQARYFGDQPVTILDATEEASLAESCLPILEAVGTSAETSTAPAADDELAGSLGLFAEALRASQVQPFGDRHRYPDPNLPPLGPELAALFSYVGSATTPDDIFQERSILEDVGRLGAAT